MGGKFKREEKYVYLWWIHIDVWLKPTAYCKAIILQIKINNFLKMPAKNQKLLCHRFPVEVIWSKSFCFFPVEDSEVLSA